LYTLKYAENNKYFVFTEVCVVNHNYLTILCLNYESLGSVLVHVLNKRGVAPAANLYNLEDDKLVTVILGGQFFSTVDSHIDFL
jgi:hypothetical protein